MVTKEEVEWRDIPGYEGMYQASSSGQIRSLNKTVKGRFGARQRKGKVLKPGLAHGYQKVYLLTDQFRVHRLVAMAFLKNMNPNEYTVVNHKNGDKNDNTVSNLEWCTPSQNMRHAYKTGLMRRHDGGKRKFDDCQILTVLTCENISRNRLAKHYSVTQAVIRSIKTGQSYREITGFIL